MIFWVPFNRLGDGQTTVDHAGDGAYISRMKIPRTGALLLALIPFIAICFSVPLWDRVYPLVLGLPFNLFWLICWIPLTSVCLWGAYRLQDRGSDKGASG
jgi:Protein of unknown function (DUF3311)